MNRPLNTGTYTVTWSLKDTGNTTWSDNSTGNKSANWSINWVNGQSHYSNDIYNRGWLAPGWVIKQDVSNNQDHLSTNEYSCRVLVKEVDKHANPPVLQRFGADISGSSCWLTFYGVVYGRGWDEYANVYANYSSTITNYTSSEVKQFSSTGSAGNKAYYEFKIGGARNAVNIYRVYWIN